MRRAILILLAVLGNLGQAADVGPSSPEMKEKLQAVIRKQLEAFRKDDYQAAYKFAAESIKAQFPVDAFERMVRVGYPLIAKSNEVKFGLSLDDGDTGVVTVKVISGDSSATYQYMLERNGDDWRITGVEQLDEKTTVI